MLVFVPTEEKLTALSGAVSGHTHIAVTQDGSPLIAFYKIHPNKVVVWNYVENRCFTEEFVTHMHVSNSVPFQVSWECSNYVTDRQILQYLNYFGRVNHHLNADLSPIVVVVDNEPISLEIRSKLCI